MTEMASAPPSAAARAIEAMSVTFGVSLARIGQRQACRTPRHHASAHRRIGAKIHPARHVGAGNVQLDCGHARGLVEPAGQGHEFVVIVSGDADDDRRPQPRQVRQVMGDEGFDAVVVQADRIEHARGGFDRSPGSVAGPRFGVIVLGRIAARRARSTRPAISRA